MDKWDKRFLDLAEHISQWSKDPSTKVGAVLADSKKRVISVGYNGLPMGIEDTNERLNDRKLKIKITIHAEENAILFSQRDRLEGCTLYVWPFMTCAGCALIAIQVGISRIVAPASDNPRWADEFELAKELIKEKNIELELI